MSNRDPKYGHLFTVSGDLNEKALWAFAHSGLTADERQVAEQHIAGCEFCRDAVEGASHIKSEAAWHHRVTELNHRIDARTGRKPRRQVMVVPPRYQRLAAAAVLFIVAGIAIVWLSKRNHSQPENIAAEKPVIQPSPSPAVTLAPAVKDSIAHDTVQLNKEENRPVTTAKGTQMEKVEQNMEAQKDVAAEEEVTSMPKSKTIIKEMEAPSTSKGSTAANTDTLKDMTYQLSTAANSVNSTAYSREARSQNTPEAASPRAADQYDLASPGQAVTADKNSNNAVPQYKGGTAAIQNYIDTVATNRENMRPATHKVELDIDENGKVVNVKILTRKRLTSDEQEIKNALLAMPAWKPAYNTAGQPVKSNVIVNLDY